MPEGDKNTSNGQRGDLQLSKNTKITIGSAIATAAVIIAFLNKDTTFRLETLDKIKDLERDKIELIEDVQELEDEIIKDYIKKIELERWLYRLKQANPELNVPEI